MNLVQFKTNIHEFERCERDVILFILDYLTEKYIHGGGGGGGGGRGFQHQHSIKIQESEAEGVQISRFSRVGSSLFRKAILQQSLHVLYKPDRILLIALYSIYDFIS